MPTATASLPPPPHAAKAGLFKRITTKLRTPHPAPSPSSPSPSNAPHRKIALTLPSVPRPKAPAHPTTFASPEQREAALRARGLVPRRPRGDTLPLSAQEAAHDARFSVLVEEPRASGSSDESAARAIREAWAARNVVNEVGVFRSSSSSSISEADEEHEADVVSGSPISRVVASEEVEEPSAPSALGDPAAGPDCARRNGGAPISGGPAPPPGTHAAAPKPSPLHPAPHPPLKTEHPLPPLPPAPSSPSPSPLLSPSSVPTPRTPKLKMLAVQSNADMPMPALSPTRTTSSTTTSDAPHTPHVDDASSLRLPTRPVKPTTVAAVIVESPVEDDEPSPLPSPTARTRRGLFKRTGASTPDLSKPPRPVASLTNLRRSVTSKLSLRPKSALVLDTASMPTSPTSAKSSSTSPTSPPPSAYKGAVPRPRRQPLSPTMHSRGSILLQAKEIEDEESRRLSEAAFLDF